MLWIRPALGADAHRLAVLAEKTFRETYDGTTSPQSIDRHCETHFAESIQAAEIGDADTRTMVADLDGELIGFGQLRRGDVPECLGPVHAIELRRIYVGRAWHGRGVAQSLMRALIEQAQRFGADSIWLGVWENNPRAIVFYRKLGFRKAGSHVFRLDDTEQRDLVMLRSIADVVLPG